MTRLPPLTTSKEQFMAKNDDKPANKKNDGKNDAQTNPDAQPREREKTEEAGAPDQNATADTPDEKKGDNIKAPEKTEEAEKQEVVLFASTRYPAIQIQVKGKDLREGIKFVDGKYATNKPNEIELLDSLEYVERV